MTKYKVTYSSSFKKDFKRIKKRNYKLDLLVAVVKKLANGETLSPKHRDHLLSGKYIGRHECHIAPDWLLIYRLIEDKAILSLSRTGTHSDLFK